MSTTKSDSLDPVPIEGLEPGETYEFKIVSLDGENAESESDIEAATMYGTGGIGKFVFI